MGSFVDEDTCALFVAIERVMCSTPTFGGLWRSGARVCNPCGRAPWHGPDAGEAGAEDHTAPPRLVCVVGCLRCACHRTSRRGSPSASQRTARCPLQLLVALDRRHCAVLARRGPGSDDSLLQEGGRSKLLLASALQGLAPQLRWPSVSHSGRYPPAS